MAIVIDEGPSDGPIQIGNRVTVESNGSQRTYQIVGSQETDPKSGRISYLSPIGAALLGHLAGDVATVQIDGRVTEYKIIEVK